MKLVQIFLLGVLWKASVSLPFKGCRDNGEILPHPTDQCSYIVCSYAASYNGHFGNNIVPVSRRCAPGTSVDTYEFDPYNPCSVTSDYCKPEFEIRYIGKIPYDLDEDNSVSIKKRKPEKFDKYKRQGHLNNHRNDLDENERGRTRKSNLDLSPTKGLYRDQKVQKVYAIGKFKDLEDLPKDKERKMGVKNHYSPRENGDERKGRFYDQQHEIKKEKNKREYPRYLDQEPQKDVHSIEHQRRYVIYKPKGEYKHKEELDDTKVRMTYEHPQKYKPTKEQNLRKKVIKKKDYDYEVFKPSRIKYDFTDEYDWNIDSNNYGKRKLRKIGHTKDKYDYIPTEQKKYNDESTADRRIDRATDAIEYDYIDRAKHVKTEQIVKERRPELSHKDINDLDHDYHAKKQDFRKYEKSARLPPKYRRKYVMTKPIYKYEEPRKYANYDGFDSSMMYNVKDRTPKYGSFRIPEHDINKYQTYNGY